MKVKKKLDYAFLNLMTGKNSEEMFLTYET